MNQSIEQSHARRAPRKQRQRSEFAMERDRDMVARRAAGESLDSIGSSYGVSRERVRQIIQKVGGPSAKRAHIAAANVKAAAKQVERDMFASQYLAVARDLASRGQSLRNVVARLKAIDPKVDEELASSVLRDARIVFSQDWSEDFLSDSALVAAVWFAFGLDYQIPPDAALAVATLDEATIRDVSAALIDQGVDDVERARVLGVVAAARRFATDNAKVTLTGARYEAIRSEQLIAWSLNSTRGTHFWPPNRQTAMARFGGWSETLERAGLRKSKMGRAKGLLKYSAEEYHETAADFVAYADNEGLSTSVDRYAQWRLTERAVGSERPSSAALRNVFGSWSQAIRSAREVDSDA